MPVRNSLRALGMAALAAVAVLTTTSPAPAAAATPTAAQRVIAIAKTEIGKPWRFAAEGPNAFDCSGLVQYAFQHAGLGSVGGGHSALGMLRWYTAHGLASRSNPQVGDLVVYSGGGHVGIYIGGGKAISALSSGVRIHGVYALRGRFTAFLHTGISGAPAPAVAASAATAARSTSKAAPHATASRLTTTSLRLRAGDSLSSRVVAVLAPGTRLAVLGSARAHGITWYHVRAGSRLGWVAAAYTRGG